LYKARKSDLRTQIDLSKDFDAVRLETGKHYLNYRILLRNQIKEVAFTALNLLFLANGGAVIATLTFLGAAIGGDESAHFISNLGLISRSIEYYVWGVCSALLAMIAMYVIYEIQVECVSSPYEIWMFMDGRDVKLDEARRSAAWPETSIKWQLKISWVVHLFAFLFAIYSAYAFSQGSLAVSRSLSTIATKDIGRDLSKPPTPVLAPIAEPPPIGSPPQPPGN
jgi:hypothetical protein